MTSIRQPAPPFSLWERAGGRAAPHQHVLSHTAAAPPRRPTFPTCPPNLANLAAVVVLAVDSYRARFGAAKARRNSISAYWQAGLALLMQCRLKVAQIAHCHLFASFRGTNTTAAGASARSKFRRSGRPNLQPAKAHQTSLGRPSKQRSVPQCAAAHPIDSHEAICTRIRAMAMRIARNEPHGLQRPTGVPEFTGSGVPEAPESSLAVRALSHAGAPDPRRLQDHPICRLNAMRLKRHRESSRFFQSLLAVLAADVF